MYDLGEVIGAILVWIILILIAVFLFRKIAAALSRERKKMSLKSLEKIEKLAHLKNTGAISDSEYETEKAKLIGS
ncbi:hypothetical protein WSK_1484 [Novosphingobium sp. Rr 2-17]|uniref:SHOCT domain-containing protein n=1 Tax=Novosphingobium sp. Rr 2-17 TaxID=555793 RepID=UPI00026991BD|nr:SHOCT domain-containing protein [Novosphingobium sp. Rr 2-17]EIZ79890.1 hypothetical protein WSK_1484 [Novosphingobium sp. Rr 2-17]